MLSEPQGTFFGLLQINNSSSFFHLSMPLFRRRPRRTFRSRAFGFKKRRGVRRPQFAKKRRYVKRPGRPELKNITNVTGLNNFNTLWGAAKPTTDSITVGGGYNQRIVPAIAAVIK